MDFCVIVISNTKKPKVFLTNSGNQCCRQYMRDGDTSASPGLKNKNKNTRGDAAGMLAFFCTRRLYNLYIIKDKTNKIL